MLEAGTIARAETESALPLQEQNTFRTTSAPSSGFPFGLCRSTSGDAGGTGRADLGPRHPPSAPRHPDTQRVCVDGGRSLGPSSCSETWGITVLKAPGQVCVSSLSTKAEGALETELFLQLKKGARSTPCFLPWPHAHTVQRGFPWACSTAPSRAH